MWGSKELSSLPNVLWLIKCQWTRTPTEVCFTSVSCASPCVGVEGTRHGDWGRVTVWSLELQEVTRGWRALSFVLVRRKAFLSQSSSLRSETVVHTPLEMFSFQLALFPGLATWYAVSAKREGCSLVFTSWKQLLQHLLKIFSSFVLPQRYLYCFWHERRKYELIFLQFHIQICSHTFSMPSVIILWIIIEFAFFPLTRQEPRNQYDLKVKCQFID